MGYAITERLQLGIRGLGGVQPDSALVLALAPAVSVRVRGPIWLGASFVVGHFLESGSGSVMASGATPSLDRRHATRAPLGVTAGNGLEMSLAVVETASGALLVQMLPVFLLGSRNPAVAVPLGVSYRFF